MKRIGIIRGGEGKEYDSSLKRGGEIISFIRDNMAEKYKVLDIFVDKSGVWHLNGLPLKPSDLAHKIDVAWNVSHQSLSNTLDSFSIPHIGKDSFSHVLENSREMLKEHMKKIKVPMPRSLLLPMYQEDFDGPRERYSIKKAKEVFEKFGAPWMVKAFPSDPNMGVHLAKTFPELVNAIEDGVNHGKSILVEEFIVGKAVSLHSLSGFRNQDVYTFPVGGSSGNFSAIDKEILENKAKDIHRHIGARHYLRSDFIFDKRQRVHLIKIDFHPDLGPQSNFSETTDLVGAKVHHVIEHIVNRV